MPWAKAGVGAIATQSWANTTYGPKGLELLESGLSNKDIARRLFISVATVKSHVHSIFEKLQVSRRAEAAAWLRRHPASLVRRP